MGLFVHFLGTEIISMTKEFATPFEKEHNQYNFLPKTLNYLYAFFKK